MQILSALEKAETRFVSDLQLIAERLVLYRLTKVREKNRELEFLSDAVSGVITSSRGAENIPQEVARLGTLSIEPGVMLYKNFDEIVTALEVMNSGELFNLVERLRREPLQKAFFD